MDNSTQRKMGAILSYITIFLNIIISLIYTPLLTSKLGQSEYGLYSLVSSLISSLTILDFGFGNAIIVYSSKFRASNKIKEEQKLYGMFIVVYTIIGLIVTLLGMFLMSKINLIFGSTMSANEINTAKVLMGILIINLAINFPLSVFSSIIISYEKFIFSKLVHIMTIILRPLIMIPLLFLGFKSITLAIVITLVNILSFIVNIIYCKKHLKVKILMRNFDFALLLQVFSFSFWIFLNEIIDKVNWSLDNFLLGSLSGTIAVASYSIASQINQLYISFSTAISGVLLPKIATMVEKKSSDYEFTEILIKTGRIQLMIVGLILSGFIIFGKNFIILWVGAQYKNSYYIAVALMLPMIISLIQNSCTSIVQAKGKHKFMPCVLIITSLLNIFISIPLIKRYGGLGAALGTAVSLIIGNIIIKNIYYHKVVKIDVIKFFKQIFKLSIFIIGITLISIIIVSYFKLNTWIKLIIAITIYTFFYMLGIRFLINDYEIQIVKSFANKIKELKIK